MLSRHERKAFCLALFALPLTALLVKVYGVQRTWTKLTPKSAGHSALPVSSQLTAGREVARMVSVAAHRGPYKATCLTRSLVLFWLLRRQGLPCELMIGTQLTGGLLSAHAWVELFGTPLNDKETVGEEFKAFDMTGDRSKP
jgi:hypothetical protein